MEDCQVMLSLSPCLLVPLSPCLSSLCLCGSILILAYTAEANGIPRQASIGEARRLAEPITGTQRLGCRFPGAAAKDVLFAISRSTRVLLGTRLIIALVIHVVAPLGHVAVHVEQAPGVGLLLADRMRLLGGIIDKPGIVAQLSGLAAEGVVRIRSSPASIFPFRLRG